MSGISGLNIGHLSTLYHTSLLLSGLNWVEERLGVQAHWRLFGSGPAIIDAFEEGTIDLGYVGLPPVIMGVARGVRIKCIAGGHVEGTVLLAGSDFKSLGDSGSLSEVIKQFKGRMIGSPAMGSIHDIIIRELIGLEGLQDQIAVENYAWADLIVEALAEGEIDAAVGTPALAVMADRTLGTKIILPPGKVRPNNPSYGIIARSELIEEIPDILEGFLHLHEDASNLIRLNPRKGAQVVSKVVGVVDEDFVLETLRLSPKYCAALPTEFIEASMAFVPLLTKLKMISRPINAEDLFDTRLIERVHPQPAHYQQSA